MNKAIVVATVTGGILICGWLVFPFTAQSSIGVLFGTNEQVIAVDNYAPLNGVDDIAGFPQTPTRRPFTPVIKSSTAAVHPTLVPTRDATDRDVPAQELTARRERSDETFRRLQKSFHDHDARQAADPRKKSSPTRGGVGTPLVCEPNQHGTAIIHEPIPFGFIFDPKEYPNGRIELRNVQSVPLVVTVRGDDHVLINGQPATTGVEYPLDESLEITSPGQVRIHVAPGSAPLNSLDGRG